MEARALKLGEAISKLKRTVKELSNRPAAGSKINAAVRMLLVAKGFTIIAGSRGEQRIRTAEKPEGYASHAEAYQNIEVSLEEYAAALAIIMSTQGKTQRAVKATIRELRKSILVEDLPKRGGSVIY